MKLLPRTLFGQLLLALCAGLIAAQAAGIWLTLNDRVRFGQGLQGSFAAQRIAGAISILEEAGPGDRTRLLHALNIPPTHISLDEPWQKAEEPANEDANAFLARIQQELPKPASLQVLSIKRGESRRHEDNGPGPNLGNMTEPPPPPAAAPSSQQPAMHPLPPASMIPPDAPPEHTRHANRHPRQLYPVLFVAGQARLADGTVITFRYGVPDSGSDGPLRLLAMLAVIAISVAALSAWAVRRLTLPLAALADAASGLAHNLERPPLPETGPLEVAQAAKAFNLMQRELKRYLETRAQALAAVSHDLRLPITRLRLRIERISEADLRAKMESDLVEMDDMIGNTLEFLRAGSITEKTSRIDINALIESVAEDMITLGAQIKQSGYASEPLVARPQALRRCLANLLDNAHRYGDDNIDITITEQAEMVEIRIEDRGPGIPEADLERVFEPYVRLESSRSRHTGGTGLGLAITRAIARSHGGDVVLAARANGGVSAILTLPRTV